MGYLSFTAPSFSSLLFRTTAQALSRPSPPAQVAHLYKNKEEFEQKQAYQSERLRFGMFRTAVDSALNCAFLLYGYYPATWAVAGEWSTALAHVFARGQPSEPVQSAVWVVLLTLISTVLGLPWKVYSTFYLEAKHGFNKTSLSTFVSDMVKSLLLTLVLAPPLTAVVVLILLHTGPYVALYLWLFAFILSLVMMTVYPVLIAPLFNKYDPLPDGSLRTQIESLAASLSFPLKKLFVMDGSRRSAHSNAFMYGFFNNKRIVLFDTLLSQCSEEQVVSVLAHELGHWALRHTPILFTATQFILAVQLSVFATLRSAPGLYDSFLFSPTQRPVLASLLLFQLIIGPVDEVLGLLSNAVSRRFEFQADAFAVKLGRGEALIDALCTLDKENKGPPNVDPLYSAYHYSHPPLPERLRAISDGMKKQK